VSHHNGRTWLREFGNKVMRISGAKGDEVAWNWRKLHNEEFQIVYYCRIIYYLDEYYREDEVGRTYMTVCFSETLASNHESTWLQNPEEQHHHTRRRKNLKSHRKVLFSSRYGLDF
jgi:hypothetical protein